MKTKKGRYHLIVSLLVASLFIFPGLLKDAQAQEDIKRMRLLRTERKPHIDTVTIENKAEKNRFIFVGDRKYRVSPGAVILGYDGKEIPLGQLPAPCKAEISYRYGGPHSYPMVEKILLK